MGGGPVVAVVGVVGCVEAVGAVVVLESVPEVLAPAGLTPAITTIPAGSDEPPAEPRNAASPKVKIPPSEATNQ
ncbi:hypothetical protein D3C83_102470 [compost metagenome]